MAQSVRGGVKPKQYKVEDSNIANLGSELEKNVKKAAAETEQAWKGAGKQVGLLIWRIEKFKVVAWPKESYGSFFDGDSYIVLHTYKKPDIETFFHDLYFWLGEFTTQDEAGTAAYKTVELDDVLGGSARQHREVGKYESQEFLGLFSQSGEKGIKILCGGVETGFKHVEEAKARTRLLHLKGRKNIRILEVECHHTSLNSGDVYILETNEIVYQWNGKKSSIGEKNRAAKMARQLVEERKGKPKISVQDDGMEDVEFWKLLGSDTRPDKIKTAEEGGSDEEAEKSGVKRLFQLSDATGTMVFKEIASGVVKRSMLNSDDAFIFDVGAEVFVWVGKGASENEKKKALGFAQDYLTKNNRPAWLPICRILETGDNNVFEGHFDK